MPTSANKLYNYKITAKGDTPSMIYDIGYYGDVRVANERLLATGGSVQINWSPIYSSGVWGANYYNAMEKIDYANQYVVLSSDIDYELTSNKVVENLGDWAFNKRNQTQKYLIYPNGVAGYSGYAYCIGANFNTSQDSLVSGKISLKTADVNSKIVVKDNTASNNGNTTNFDDFVDSYISVYPFWATGIILDNVPQRNYTPTFQQNALLKNVVSWDIGYSTDLVFVVTCSGKSGAVINPLTPQYVCLGTLQSSGSFQVLQINNMLAAQNIRNHRAIEITIRDANKLLEKKSITCNNILIQSGDLGIQTGNNLIQTNFSFTAIGDGSQPPLKFYPNSLK